MWTEPNSVDVGGAPAHIATGITDIFSDEGAISNYLYESL